jgi:uncharacterized membrane protein (UPF0136 family)
MECLGGMMGWWNAGSESRFVSVEADGAVFFIAAEGDENAVMCPLNSPRWE